MRSNHVSDRLFRRLEPKVPEEKCWRWRLFLCGEDTLRCFRFANSRCDEAYHYSRFSGGRNRGGPSSEIASYTDRQVTNR